MASKSATSTVAQKVPVALFIAAIFILMQGLIARERQDGAGASLPDPAQMAVLSLGRLSSSDIVELWESRVQATPSSPTFRSRLAASKLSLAGQTGDLSLYGEAEAIARSAVAIDPSNESANLTLASALAGQHDFAGALELADGVLERTPRSVNARIAAGDAHLELGDYAVAEQVFAELGDELPGVPSILSREARIAALTGRLNEAIDLARGALVAAGEDDLDSFTAAFYWFQLANYQYQAGRYDDAASTLDAALEVEPDHIGSIELLGKVLSAEGNYDDATRLYENLLKRTDAADLRSELSKLYALVGRFDESERQVALGLDIARQQAVRFAAERRHLIGFYADHDPDEAVRLARADLEIRSDVQTYGWLAWALLQAGEPEEALTYVESALALGTEDAWLLYQAGSVYAAVGDVDRARTLLTQAIDLNPEFDIVHAPRARALLEGLPGDD
jgi:tetratricopeptide (TPR) repeat protein